MTLWERISVITATRAHEVHDIRNTHDVKQFVNNFYDRVRADSVLGNIFDDIAHVNWPRHLPLMYQFWETILFTRPGYKGNPLLPHVELNESMQRDLGIGLQTSDFERWTELFHATIDELFSGPCAEKAKRSAVRIGQHILASVSGTSGPFTFLPYRRQGRVVESRSTGQKT